MFIAFIVYCLFVENRKEISRKSLEKVSKNRDLCGILMPLEKDKILEFNQYMKSDKMAYIIYADMGSLIRKIDECAYNPESSSTTKIGEHIPCGYSMSTIWAFDHFEQFKHLKTNILYIPEKIVWKSFVNL